MVKFFSMDVIAAPNPKLRIKTKPVKKITPALILTIKNMIKLTKTFKDPEGVGLASTQIGLNERFFVAKNNSTFSVYINPQILKTSKRSKNYFEGCLSIPNTYGQVRRPISVTVQYLDQNEQMIKKNLKGLEAWIFQHEMDHLNGVLFPDRVLEQKGQFYKWMGRDKTGQDIFEEVTL